MPTTISTPATLVRRFGHQQVAQIQNELDDLVRLGPDLPLTTAACRELARRTHIERAVAAAGQADEEAVAVAGKCYAAAFWLLMADVDPSASGGAPQGCATSSLRSSSDAVSASGDGCWRSSRPIPGARKSTG